MEFIEQVNSIKENILKRPEYARPLNELMETAKGYNKEKNLKDSLNDKSNEKSNEEELTID